MMPQRLSTPTRGALTLRLHVIDGALPYADVANAVAEVKAAMAMAYGVGWLTSPVDQAPIRFIEDGRIAEVKVTVQTPDGGARLVDEVKRRRSLSALVHRSIQRGPG